MDQIPPLKIIAHIHTDFTEKFGIPRQSGLAEGLLAKIVFLPEYRDPNAFRGLDGYSHIWLLWQFSKAIREDWLPMVHPPRLGGNTLMGVFATRSPFRPNPIGLSSVKLEKIEMDEKLGPVLTVSGADILDGTPIYDIKPYLSYTDSHPGALGGFADEVRDYSLQVEFPDELLQQIPEDRRKGLIDVLAQDPRPSYQNDPNRKYGFQFAGFDVRFCVADGVITVCELVKL